MSCRAADLFPMVAPSMGEGGTCFDPTNQDQIDQFLAAFNRGLPMLMKRIDAEGTLSRWCVPVHGGVFGLPWDCKEVRQVFVDGCEATLRDQWFEGQIGHKLSDCHNVCGSSDLVDMGDGYATPFPWPGNYQDARYGVMAEADSDAGKVVQIKLLDRYGNEYEEEITLLPNQQIASSQRSITDLKFQHKGVTNGAIVGFVTLPHARPQRILRLPPRVQAANFKRKKLPRAACATGGELSIIGKLRFIPLTSQYDTLPICDIAALNFLLQAMSAMDRKDLTAYNAAMEFSLNELRREMSDSQPAGAVSQMRITSPCRFNQRRFY